ncbi:MAG: DUF4397 domain-containing protein [Clostridium sp.]|nr:DUF4397 domain-containing protein [Clostridium sp.]MBS6936113.1 DUF4397 domain-containing protein [Clostridium sp.]
MNQQTNEFYREQQQRDLPQTLPSYPDVDGSGPAVEGVPDTPQTLPSYPDVDGSAPPVYPQPIPPIVTQPGQPVMRCCRVRFFHAAVQAGSLNVNVGSQRVASNLAFGNFSTYYCFAEGFRTVSLINAGSGRTLLLRKTVPMSYGEQLTFVIVNNASTGALELVRVNDTACSGQMGGFGCLRMANFLLGDTALDLLTADGRVLFSDVRYKETTLSRRLRPGSYSFLVANTPVRIEPRIQDVEMDQGEWRISQRYLPGYGEMDLLLSFGMQARRGVLSTAYIIGQANTGEVQVVVSENR